MQFGPAKPEQVVLIGLPTLMRIANENDVHCTF